MSLQVRRPMFWHIGHFFACCFALVAVPVFAGTLDKIKESGAITIGYRETSLPFSYLVNDKPVGYSMDLCYKVVDAIRKQLKMPDIKIKLVAVTSATRIPAMKDGSIDLECGSTTSTGERRKEVSFTIPTFIAGARLLVKASSGIKNVYDLGGKTVVATSGTTHEKFFKQMNENMTLNAKVITAKDHAESFSMIESGKADAYINDDVLLFSQRATSSKPSDFSVTRDLLTIEPLSIMTRKDDTDFNKLVDREITRMILDNEVYAIYHKWFESPVPPNNINLNLPMSYLLRDSFKAPTPWLPN